MTYPDRDPRPADRPTEALPRPGVPRDQPTGVPYQQEEVVERGGDGRARTVRVVCAVIDVVCWLFAGFARMIDSWSAGVSLGLRDLFTPANAGLRTLLNDGLAAVLWLVIGAVLTNVITRVALPAAERRVWYRRTVR